MERNPEELSAVLRYHFRVYPKMQPQDAVKLIYQHVFGPGHLLSDPASARDALAGEYAAAEQTAAPYEPLGNGFARLNFGGVKLSGSPLSPETIFRMFELTASKEYGDTEAFIEKLGTLLRLAGDGEAPFGRSSLDAFLASYASAGYPMARHSDAYRAAYRPAYRVVSGGYIPLLGLLSTVDRLLAEMGSVNIGIDGRAGSGKSTLAETLAEVYGGAVISMDDFFLPVELRTNERLKAPGGNVHYERFLGEVAPGLRARQPAAYRVFDCGEMAYAPQKKQFLPARVNIVEGSYCMRENLRELYDIRVFLTVGRAEQLRRIAARNGEEARAAFEARWIPMEERYFAAFRIEDAADIVIDTSSSC